MPPKTLTPNEMLAEIARLTKANEELAKSKNHQGPLTLKVSEKGAVSIYGMGRFPVTLYAEQWEKLLATKDTIVAFIEVNRKSGRILSKDERKAREAASVPLPTKPSSGAL